jgi:hypothetical protein
VAVLLSACGSAAIPARTARVSCGSRSDTAQSDTAVLDIALDSAAAATISRVDFEVGGGTHAEIRVDSVSAVCWSASPGLQIWLTGAWQDPPYLHVGAGARRAHLVISVSQTVLADTVLSMTGPVYRSVTWPKGR